MRTGIVRDEDAHIRYFDAYLAAFKEHDLDETMLVGGQIAVDTLMIWQRTSETKHLMEIWVENARKVEPKLIIHFVKRDIDRSNLVTTLFLLTAFGMSCLRNIKPISIRCGREPFASSRLWSATNNCRKQATSRQARLHSPDKRLI